MKRSNRTIRGTAKNAKPIFGSKILDPGVSPRTHAEIVGKKTKERAKIIGEKEKHDRAYRIAKMDSARMKSAHSPLDVEASALHWKEQGRASLFISKSLDPHFNSMWFEVRKDKGSPKGVLITIRREGGHGDKYHPATVEERIIALEHMEKYGFFE